MMGARLGARVCFGALSLWRGLLRQNLPQHPHHIATHDRRDVCITQALIHQRLRHRGQF